MRSQKSYNKGQQFTPTKNSRQIGQLLTLTSRVPNREPSHTEDCALLLLHPSIYDGSRLIERRVCFRALLEEEARRLALTQFAEEHLLED